MHFSLNLKNSQQETTSVRFNVRSHTPAQHWFSLLKEAEKKSKIREGKRWYNFDCSDYGSFDKLSLRLNEVIDELNKQDSIHIDRKVDLNNLQESINYLHVNFADSHLITHSITSKNESLWNDFNNLLHAFEALERSLKTEQKAGMKSRSIVFTWDQNFKESLNDDEFSHFTVGKQFGTIYINYCQVGRHIFEMYLAQDDLASDEHIQPLKHVSADSYLWLGPTSKEKGIEKKMKGIKDWFFRNQSKLNQLGYHWGDPKLAIGWTPVADLALQTESLEDQLAIIDEFEKYDEVCGVTTL